MGLAEQAARRVDLARTMGAEPRAWVATSEAEMQLIANAGPAWSADGALLHGLPIERAAVTRSEWGLDLVLGPRAL